MCAYKELGKRLKVSMGNRLRSGEAVAFIKTARSKRVQETQPNSDPDADADSKQLQHGDLGESNHIARNYIHRFTDTSFVCPNRSYLYRK